MGLKKHWFHILLALAEGPTHGAEIRRRVREHTGGRLKLYPAMLYGSLEDLEKGGLISEIDERSGRPTGETDRYRYYRMTLTGCKALEEEAEHLEEVAQRARAALATGRSR